MFRAAHSYATLARWLGPWASDMAYPRRVTRSCVTVPAPSGDSGAARASFPAWLYLPPRGRTVRGSYLIAPGLHYAGPADPRMDRLCQILAASGFVVLAPFLPDYTSLRVAATSFEDFRAAFDYIAQLPSLQGGPSPAIFSISFGSLLALRLASESAYKHRISHMILFGGYADWHEAIMFCLTGEIQGAPHGTRDPLNQPVVFMNLVDTLPGAPADPTALLAAWRRQVEATWGRPELKLGERRLDKARAEAQSLPSSMRELFLIGCGAAPGAVELCTAALDRAQGRGFMDPRPHMPAITCSVTLVHGLDDDVIPYVQSEQLAKDLDHVTCQLYLTGLYGHTAKSGGASFGAAPTLAKELWTMTRILRSFVSAP